MNVNWTINVGDLIAILGALFAAYRWLRSLHKKNEDRLRAIEHKLLTFDHFHECMDKVKDTIDKWNEIFTEIGIRDSARERRGRK